jgi:N-acetyl-1-D-myo-inositol-2-amino-2-deoxy-alpha-D-glucopyranoside deacetylase
MRVGARDGLPAFSAHTRLLVVAPHPDDETIATGVLIQQVRAAGGEVRIVLLTAGDNNPWPQRWLERRWRIGAPDRQRWARRRGEELLHALAVLGISPPALQTLSWPDMGVTDLLLHSPDDAVSTVTEAINRFTPDLIVLPSLHDHHPDHSAAHVLVRLALAGHAEPPALFTYLVHGDAGSRPFVRIDPTPAQMTNKCAALQEHRSQVALSGKRLQRLTVRPECYVDVRDEPRSTAAILPWQPPRWLQPWLRLDVVSLAGVHRWAWPDAPLRHAADGAFHLSLPVSEQVDPRFAKLSFSLTSPWIFDHWGWCELPALEEPPTSAVA